MIVNLSTNRIHVTSQQRTLQELYPQHGGEPSRHRYETKLRHCHPTFMYIQPAHCLFSGLAISNAKIHLYISEI